MDDWEKLRFGREAELREAWEVILRGVRRIATASVLAVTLCALPACGSSDESSAGGCAAPDGVPGTITEITGSCEDAQAVAAAYFEKQALPAKWTCGPYPGKANAIQCYTGGCEPDPSDDPGGLAQTIMVTLEPGTSESSYQYARNCRG